MIHGHLGKASHDLGDPASTFSHLRTALACSRRSGDPNLQAWIYALQSFVMFWTGNAGASIEYAQLGLGLSSISGDVPLWLAALEARSKAPSNSSAEVRGAFAAIEQARHTMTDDGLNRFGGLMRFPPSSQPYYNVEARVLSNDGDNELGQDLTAAIKALATDSHAYAFGSLLAARCAHALYFVKRSQIENALTAIGPVLESDVSTHINGVVICVARVSHLLSAHNLDKSGAGAELQKQLRAFQPVF